jgi:AraC-like DNA-binding protein
MLAIPVPFVVSMLLILLAVILYVRIGKQAKTVCLFLALCASTTTMVGLRWTFDVVAFSYAQPILASLIPVFAWYTFTRASSGLNTISYLHLLGPTLVMVSVITQPVLGLPLDGFLSGTYLFYGITLVRYSSQDTLLINVTLSNWEGVKKAENIAGWMLLFSALIDMLLSLDFSFNQGRYSQYILTVGHLILLPVLSFAVVIVGVNTPLAEATSKLGDIDDKKAQPLLIADERINEIVELLDKKIRDKAIYLDPDLTLSRLSRKLGIPAKQISIAVNMVHRKNISKLINEYRIEHAKQELTDTDNTITQVFMNSGFQTKSNFNREFFRVTKMTPSEYRKIDT